jgi:hypothetical protein
LRRCRSEQLALMPLNFSLRSTPIQFGCVRIEKGRCCCEFHCALQISINECNLPTRIPCDVIKEQVYQR